ncbi:MAG: hypothetical protein GF411_08110 [Candidatus Lokiarchaeota archaeon]|nr:hypothetical protein [Candidatus Lokiarchaeota archaeon]
MRLEPEDIVMVTRAPMTLVDTEKSIVRLENGALWCYVTDGRNRVGIAFQGKSSYAVDAIGVTSRGAVGQSYSGTLEGIQIFLGSTIIEDISKPPLDPDFQGHGFDSPHGFVQSVIKRIDTIQGEKESHSHWDESDESNILLGNNGEHDIILIPRNDGLVYIHGKTVFVLNDEKLVSVEGKRVVISGDRGEEIIIDKDGIHGLDIPDVGQIVQTAMTGAMRDLGVGMKDLGKSIRHVKKSEISLKPDYDDVDDLDWDDDE